MSYCLKQLIVGIKGAGEMASAVAWRLYQANIKRIFMCEVPQPLAVRRKVSFCEAVYEGRQVVEDVTAVMVQDLDSLREAWERGYIGVAVDPHWELLKGVGPQVLVDGILAKRNLGTSRAEAPLVIALGPGFIAGVDAHMVIETNRGHDLGRIITQGEAQPNTGVPGNIGGYTEERVLRAPGDGVFQAIKCIGDLVSCEDVVGRVDDLEVRAGVSGVIRGLIRDGTLVNKGLKIGDIDPRGRREFCPTISDKARSIAGSVLEAVLRVYNR
ncbi:MAG: selenium-dependent molybdenum cofactor biosynthesis protein YqeB [bacterium]